MIGPELCASSSANWSWERGWFVQIKSNIPLFDREDHPFVPTWPSGRAPGAAAVKDGAAKASAPAEPARSVLDRASTVLG